MTHCCRSYLSLMSSPKRHHYVPKWYLEAFAEPGTGFLHVFDIEAGAFRRQRPKEVMVIGRYYRQAWAPSGADSDILEKALGEKFEPNAKKALHRLIRSPTTITEEDTANIIVYLEIQRLRVPRQAGLASILLRNAALANSPPELARALLSGKIEVTDTFRFDFMRMLNGKLSPYFGRMSWKIFEASEGSSFITTDSPVTFYNKDFLPPTEGGLALVGTSVCFPIDTKHMLVMSHPEYIGGKCKSPSDVIQEPEKKDRGIPLGIGTVWTSAEVDRQNWMMTQLAQRFVVANDKEVLARAVQAELGTA